MQELMISLGGVLVLALYALLGGVGVIGICLGLREGDSKVLSLLSVLTFSLVSVMSLTFAFDGLMRGSIAIQDWIYYVFIIGPLIPMILNIIVKVRDKGLGIDYGSIKLVNSMSIGMFLLMVFTYTFQEGLLW